MTTAPIFNSFNALEPIPSKRSGVTAVLDAADKISREHVEADRLARDNEMLKRQNEALLCRIDELTEGGSLEQQVAELGRALLAAQTERDRALLEAHVWRGRAQCRVKS